MEYALELKNGEVCLYLLKNGRKMGDVSFTWEQAEWLYRQIGQLVIDFKNIHKTDVSKREEQIDRAGIDWFYKTKQQEADVAEAFMAGAKWADAHNEGLNMHIKYLKEELIDKACEWLYDHLYTRRDEQSSANHFVCSKQEMLTQTEFIEQFRKAMKGE